MMDGKLVCLLWRQCLVGRVHEKPMCKKKS